MTSGQSSHNTSLVCHESTVLITPLHLYLNQSDLHVSGLTKQDILDLAPLLSDENTLRRVDTKAVIITDFLQMAALLPETEDPLKNLGGGEAPRHL